MWEYTVKSDTSLHDCYIEKVCEKNGTLIVRLPDGIWLSESCPHNPFDKTIKTFEAQVRLSDFVFEGCYIFKDISIFYKPILTKRIEIKKEKLIQKVNSSEWKIEFLYDYKNCDRHIFDCIVWTKDRKNFECLIFAEYSDIEYSWNDINKDKEW